MRIENDFIDWLYGTKIYHGTVRYNQFPGNHVFASSYDSNEELRDLLDDLEAGDIEALDAGRKIAELYDKQEIWLAYDNYPEIAMAKLMQQIRNYYFNELNKMDG